MKDVEFAKAMMAGNEPPLTATIQKCHSKYELKNGAELRCKLFVGHTGYCLFEHTNSNVNGVVVGEASFHAPINPADILDEMAATFRERNKAYGANWRMVGPMLQLLHPNGITLDSAEAHTMFHLWSLLAVKLTRFAVADLKHTDSIHDAGVYCAMIETLLREKEQQ